MNRNQSISVRRILAPLLLLGVALLGPACAPAAPPAEAPATAAAAAPDGEARDLPLWELTHEGRTLYLLGSVHLLRPEVYPLDPAIYEAFDAAEVVAFELDFDEMMAAAPLMIQLGTYQDGRTLRDVLPPDLYAELHEQMTEVGMPMQAVDPMKPWMAALTLSSLVLQRGGYEAAAGIDMHFHERAKETGMAIVGLETVEEQLQVFDGLDEEPQIEMLRSTLDQLDDTVRELDRATALWQRGDAEGLAEMFIEQMGDQPEVLERLLYERNRNWIPGIEALLQRPETVIVIVGMGHLVGEGSVIELLQERGYEVRQLQGERAAVAAGG